MFGVFQVDSAGFQSPVLEFDENCTQNAYFLQKIDFCIFEPKNREVIENSSKTPLNLSSLHILGQKFISIALRISQKKRN